MVLELLSNIGTVANAINVRCSCRNIFLAQFFLSERLFMRATGLWVFSNFVQKFVSKTLIRENKLINISKKIWSHC